MRACLRPVVELTANRNATKARCPIRSAPLRRNHPSALQTRKNAQTAIREGPAFATNAIHLCNFAVLVFLNKNCPATREDMERPLLRF